MCQSATPGTASARFRQEVRRNLPFNYAAHTLEGGLFMAGLTFVSPESVLPAMVESLGGPAWVIAFMPMAMFVGFALPPLLTAHLIERLGRVHPFVKVTAVFQRLPYLAAGLGLWLLPAGYAPVLFALVAATPLLSGLFGGIGSCAWQELVARTIPPHRRSSMLAVRQIIQSVVGIVAGYVIAWVLFACPGRPGYAILHLITFGFLVLSYIVFVTIRESEPPHKPAFSLTLLENLRSLPGILAGDRRLRRFTLMIFFSSGMYIALPFLAIHALAVLGRADEFLGYLVTAQMIGGIGGNVLLGWLGDRYGTKATVAVARVSFLLVCLGGLAAGSAWAFLAVFFGVGVAVAANTVGGLTMAIEVARPERRPTYLSLIQFVRLVSMLLAAAASTLLRWSLPGFAAVALASAVCMGLSLFCLALIEDPRKEAS